MQLRIQRTRKLGARPMSIAKTEALLETVHCLVCDCTYPENAMPPIVEACPHCGNSDIDQTVYLSEEQDQ
jgi:hypothetical protein